MSHNEIDNARSSVSHPHTPVTHFITSNINRNSSRSPTPPSPAASSFGEGSFNSTSTVTTSSSQTTALPDPPVFTGLSTSNIRFSNWSAMILAKLTEMTEAKVEEKVKMEYVVAHTGRDAFQKLLDRFEEMKGKGVAFGSAKPMVMYLAQYYDENIRMTDIRFSSW